MKKAGGDVWLWWKRTARRIGDFQARLILLVFYFVVLAPFALAVRWGSDPLAIRSGTAKGWRSPARERDGRVMEKALRQY